MELDEAMKLLKKIVKPTGTIDMNHIDLTLVPVPELPKYQKALMVSQEAIKEGKISKDELMRQLNLG